MLTTMTDSAVRHDLTAVLHREYRLLTRDRTNLFLAIAPTTIYLLLFATSLTNLLGTVLYKGTAISYEEFTLPGLMLSSMLAAATMSAMSLFQERLGGMDIELWSYPLRRRNYVAGKLLATTCLVLAQSMAALAAGALVFGISWPVSHWAALLIATIVASVALNGLFLLTATLFRDFQRFTVLINVLAPMLLFASPAFYPTEAMAPALRWLSWLNPVTYGVGALRDAALSGLAGAGPWLLALAALTIPATLLTGRALLATSRNL
jgi:ABC-2 type transport system permease protein